MSFFSNPHLHLAISSLRRNRARTFLSALGIAIGVAAIVVIMSLTGGISRLIGANTDKANANLILVRPDSRKEGAENLIEELTVNAKYSKSNLELKDLTQIQKIAHVEAAAPIASTTSAIKIGDKAIQSVSIIATTKDLPNTTPLPLKNGVFFNEQSDDESEKQKEDNEDNKPKRKPTKEQSHNNVAVIGSSLANRIFGSTDVLSSIISYDDQKFIIVGVLEKLDDPLNYNGVNFDESLLIDINYASSFQSSTQIQQFNIRTDTTDSVKQAQEEIQKKLASRKDGDTTFQVLTSDSNIKSQGSLFSIISSMLTLVAFISLLIGGIGIMNIMLVSVSERTREIGIRKAVGASSGNILTQFLLESIILSIIGGIMGIIGGYLCAFVISLLTPFKPYISLRIILLTAITSLITGVIFGLYPAAKAANKAPIASLKEYH